MSGRALTAGSAEEHNACAIKDGMQEIYGDIQEADNIVIASPMYFSELTGQLLAVLSRLQTFWCAKYFRHVEPVPKKKRAVSLSCAGGDGILQKAERQHKTLLADMHAKSVGLVFATTRIPSPALTIWTSWRI